MWLKQKALYCLLLSALWSVPFVFAQQVPNEAKSGVVEKDLVQAPSNQPTPPKKNIFEELQYPKTDLLLDEGKEITVSQFEFSGNTLFRTAALQKITAQYAGKPVRFKQLQEALGRVNTLYIENGFFLARAILPAQDIANGVVKIHVVEGQLGEVVVDGGKFYKPEFIRNHFSCSVKGVINYHSLFKSLITLNEYTDLKVRAVMQKGKDPYKVDIVLKVEDKRPLHFSMDYDNYGSRFVSRSHAGIGMEYSNLVMAGDRISLREVGGIPFDHLNYGSVGYSFPVNAYGSKVGFSFARSEFQVQKEFRKMDAHGESQTMGVEFTHPLQRTLTSGMDLVLGFDHKNARNYLLRAVTSDDKLRVAKVGFSGNRLDRSFGGRNFFSVNVSQGIPDLMGGSKSTDLLASRLGSGGKFLKSRMDVARYQKLPLNMLVLVKAQAQFTNDVLPVPEQMSIGGAETVRGFSSSAHLGDTGEVVNVELNVPAPFIGAWKAPFMNKQVKDVMRMVGFVDYGYAELKKPLVGEVADHEIIGAGFGFRFAFGKDFNAKIDVGFPVSGKASSGDDTVTYLQISKKF